MRIVDLGGQQLGHLFPVITQQVIEAYRVNAALSQVYINLLLPQRLCVFKIERRKRHQLIPVNWEAQMISGVAIKYMASKSW